MIITFVIFATMFILGYYHVNVKGNSYENIYGAMLLIGLLGLIVTGWVGLGVGIYEIFQL